MVCKMQLREEVKWFAEEMEKKLLINDHKGGWDSCDFDHCAKDIFERTYDILDDEG